LTYNAQFNFCFPTIKAIPVLGLSFGALRTEFPPVFEDRIVIPTWNQTIKEQGRYSRRVGDLTRLPARVNPLSHRTPNFFSAHSARFLPDLSLGLRKPSMVTGITGNPQSFCQPRAVHSAPRLLPTARARFNRAANHTCLKTTVKHP
jgi:hypothetical protein